MTKGSFCVKAIDDAFVKCTKNLKKKNKACKREISVLYDLIVEKDNEMKRMGDYYSDILMEKDNHIEHMEELHSDLLADYKKVCKEIEILKSPPVQEVLVMNYIQSNNVTKFMMCWVLLSYGYLRFLACVNMLDQISMDLIDGTILLTFILIWFIYLIVSIVFNKK